MNFWVLFQQKTKTEKESPMPDGPKRLKIEKRIKNREETIELIKKAALKNEARQIVSELTGANDAGLVPFGTEAGIFQNLGMDVVVCGPGSIEQAHKADEFVTVDQLGQCLKMLEKLGKKDAEKYLASVNKK